MSGKWWKRCAVIAIVDAVVLALTIHAHLDFHPTANGPSVMSAGQVLGWILSGGLFVVLVLTFVSGRRSQR